MLKKDKKGFYTVNSFEQLAELYKITKDSADKKNEKKERTIREREAKKTTKSN